MTSTARPSATCPDAETLAAFGEGRLPASESAVVLAHLDECEDCMVALEAVNETIATRTAEVAPFRVPRRRSWWLAAAAMIAIGIVSVILLRDRLAGSFAGSSSMARLIDLAPRSARPVEARLSGGFPWAPYRGPMRAQDTDSNPQRLKLIGAAGEIVAAADSDRSAGAQQAAGIALVVIDQPVAATERLRTAVTTSPKDAKAWSDLGAAQYSTAVRLGRPSLLPEALDAVDRALRIEPGLAEARFNRALILERLGVSQEARVAWQSYLDADSASPWATEARERLAKIKIAPASGSLLQRDLPRLEQAAVGGNAQELAVLVDADPQFARAASEVEILGRWAEAAERGDVANADRALVVARAIADVLVRGSGESLLDEAVRAIEVAPSSTRAALAGAHTVYRRGRIAFGRRELDAASSDLERATALFDRTGSPMSLVARYYAASVRFDRNDVVAARRELQDLLIRANTQPRFLALGAQVRWGLALSLMVDGDWSGALPLLEESRERFRRLGERSHLGFIESLLADTLLSAGRMDEAWSARIRAFTLLSAGSDGDRLPVSIKAAAQMEIHSGRLGSARALLDAARARARPVGNDAIAVDVLTQSVLVSVALGDRIAAERGLRDAARIVEGFTDESARSLSLTHLELAEASMLVSSEPSRARAMLTRAIAGYRANGRTVFLPECHLLRARATLLEASGRAGPEQTDSASADLESGIRELERSRIRIGAVVGTGVLDAGNALFEDAIRLSADRDDLEGAFRYFERSRTQLGDDEGSPATIRELQARLVGSETALLQLVVLPEEIVAICVTESGAAMKRRPLARSGLDALAVRSASVREDSKSLSELYDLLIRPIEPMLRGSRELIVVADRPLQIIPLAALYDSVARRYLVETLAVSTAMSASSLRPAKRDRRHSSLLAVALSSGESNAGLPESAREIAAIAPLYAIAVTLGPERATVGAFAEAAASADVIHIAGHTARQGGDAGTALVFGSDRLTSGAIAIRRLQRTPIVVLAACETLAQHAPGYVRTLTLGGGFLAAGASDVIGTLTPIADADARDLFESFHRHLSGGAVPAEAVRAAQLEALARSSDAWRGVALLTRRIHSKTTRS